MQLNLKKGGAMSQEIKVLVLIILLASFISCNKKTESLKEKIDSTATKIGKEIDTAASKLKQNIDTLISSKGDSAFKNVTITTADNSKLASKQFRNKLNDAFTYYLHIRNELVEGDAPEAQKQARKLIDALHKSETEGGSEATDSKWKSSASSIEKIAGDIEKTNNIDKQRSLFNDLTDKMLAFVKEYGLSGKTVYLMECNKALSGRGGKWLSDSKNIDNPYFGEDTNQKSINCVKVIEGWKFE